MNHVEECFLAKPCRHNDGVHVPQEYVAGFPVTICGLCMNDCICKQLLSAGARGYKSGYDDAYWEGYEQGYDAALANGAAKPAKTYGEIQADFVIRQAEAITYFNQHGTGENP
jgi:hypothetical protein